MATMLLTSAAFEVARHFIEERARPLEVARMGFFFDQGSRESVLAALQEYQNSDGGFGRALEPDLRVNDSSALCTTVAFQILRSIDATSDSDLVSRGMAYYLETADRDRGHWRIIPRTAQGHPHAPWWDQERREQVLDGFVR